jgi:hypothetical protein
MLITSLSIDSNIRLAPHLKVYNFFLKIKICTFVSIHNLKYPVLTYNATRNHQLYAQIKGQQNHHILWQSVLHVGIYVYSCLRCLWSNTIVARILKERLVHDKSYMVGYGVVFCSPIYIVVQLATPGLVIWRFAFDFGHVIMYILASSFWEF